MTAIERNEVEAAIKRARLGGYDTAMIDIRVAEEMLRHARLPCRECAWRRREAEDARRYFRAKICETIVALQAAIAAIQEVQQ